MYLDYFRLTSSPFSIAPDPNFLYLTGKHQDALAHLLYSTTQKGGFVLLTGEIGTGKTTLCRHFLKIVPDQYQTAFIFNPKISAAELLATICDEFGIIRPEGAGSIKQLTDLINTQLLEIHSAGKNALLVIDEAQNLSMEVLEQVRLLTNLETTEHKLLQIILIGQPQLKTLLQREELRQLSQRIVARYHLEPLSYKETASYIRHRLVTAGCGLDAAASLFPTSTIRAIFKKTQGIPRLVNVLCDRAMLGAYVESSPRVIKRIVRNAEREAFGEEHRPRHTGFSAWHVAVLAACAALTIASVLWYLLPQHLTSWWRPTTTAIPPQIVVAPTRPSSTNIPTSGSASAAYRALFKLWDIPIEDPDSTWSEIDACAVADRHRMRCFSAANKNWAQYRSLNLPAVLTLRDPDQHIFYALIESASDNQVRLIINEQAVTLNLQQLAFYWTGKYTLLWQPPPGYLSDSQLAPKSLSMLTKQAPTWLYEWLGTRKETARLPMNQLIADFQKKNGLPATGFIGMQTLIILSKSANNSPTLDRPSRRETP